MSRPNHLDGLAQVQAVKPLTAEVLLLTLAAPWVAEAARPGQFVMVQTGPGHDPLLLRPLAVAGVAGEKIELLVRRVGRGTERLGRLDPGQEVLVRGPLGRGFPRPQGPTLVLAAGGVGVAPLLLAVQAWSERADLAARLVLGLPGAAWRPLAEFVADRAADLTILSDDGRLGRPGNPTSLAGEWGAAEVWACGPPAMLAGLGRVLPEETLYLVSLEARMGCGFGGCLGCVVPTTAGPKRVCVEGPVFDGREIKWRELA